MRRSVAGGVLVTIVGAAAGAGWVAGRRVASPAEVAARSKAPAASRITVAVEKTVLSSTLITRGLVRYGEPKPVVLAQSTLKTTNPVVTQAPEKARSLKEGDKAMEIGGRPVLVLEGALPTFRDLRPSDSGVDVDQLKAALRRRGFDPGVGPTYDQSTQRAVSAWYRSVGYDPFEPTDTQKQQLRTARDTAQRANDSVTTAQRSVEQAQAPDRKLQVRENARTANDRVTSAADSAQRDIERAEAEVTAREVALKAANDAARSAADSLARAERDAADRSTVEDAQASARDAVSAVGDAEQAVVDAQRARDDALAAIPDAQKVVDNARIDLGDSLKSVDDAKKSVDTAKLGRTTLRADGVTQIVISDDEVRAAEANVRAAEARVRGAEAGIRQAEAALSQRRRAADDATLAIDKAQRAVTRARDSVARSDRSVTKAQTSQTDRSAQLIDLRTKSEDATAAVARAERDLATAQRSVTTTRRTSVSTQRQAKASASIAQAALRESERGLDQRSSERQLASARENADRANTELADLEAKIGIAVPANELLFFPSLPLRIDDTKLNRGDPITGAVMTVTTARLAVDSSLDVADAKLVKVGAPVTIEASDFDITMPGRITELATTPGTKGADNDKVYVEVTPDVGPGSDAARLNGSSVKLTFPVNSTGTEVLAVPVAALSVAADGTSRVEVEDDPARPTRYVTVTPGLAAEGKVAITVVGDGQLAPGDRVVVGNASGGDVTGSSTDTIGSSSSSSDGVASDGSTTTSDSDATPASGPDAEATSSTDAQRGETTASGSN